MKRPSYYYHYIYKRRTIFVLCLILLVMIYFFQDASFLLRSITSIAFLAVFTFIDHFFDIRFRTKHYLFIILIAIFSLLLSPLYFVYPNYDKIQHFIQPVLLSSIIFYMVNKLSIKLKWKLTFTFFITLGILGIFEISEYALDSLFDLKLQGVFVRDASGLEKLNIIQEPLDDTITDLVLGILGSALYSISLLIIKRKEINK